MIFTVGTGIPESDKYTGVSIQQFLDWIKVQDAYQLDVETNMTRTVFGRLLRTIQFGEVRKTNFNTPGSRFVIHWNGLTTTEQQQILDVLRVNKQKKYIHNAVFEYGILLNYGVVLENVFDTMLAEMIKWTGFLSIDDEEGNNFYSLAGCMNRYFKIVLDKTYQTAFVHDIELTEGHIVYAAVDITDLDALAEIQVRFLKQEGLMNVLGLENEAVLAFADIEWNGMLMDKEKWLANAAEAEPLVKKYRDALDQWLLTDPKLNAYAKQAGYIYIEDTVEFNKNSPVHKMNLIKKLFPDISGATLPIIKKYAVLNDDNSELGGPYVNSDNYPILSDLCEGDWSSAFLELVRTDRQWLIDENYLVPAGTVRINWNSPTQVLPMFQSIDKRLKDLSEKSRNNFAHPIVSDFEKFKSALKLMTSYGPSFVDRFPDLDGRVRTRFNQILTTGRVSSSKPNMQQIPIIEDDDPRVMNKYRNAFIPAPGSVFVDSDYASQELVFIATTSEDPVWLRVLAEGKDLHSVCASLVYGPKWKRAASAGCKFELTEQKCKCPGHVKLRSDIKEINFGLCYGMSQYKLAGSQKITVKAAEELMALYFATFPKIGKLLTNLGGYGVQTGVIKTMAPFNRKRWFPMWDKVRAHIDEHLKGIRYNSILGEIERASKNMPVQGSCADMMKLAMVYVRRHINDNKLRDKVKLVMQVHDQLTCEVVEDYATEWSFKLTALMEKAGRVILPNGLLKAETAICDAWTK